MIPSVTATPAMGLPPALILPFKLTVVRSVGFAGSGRIAASIKLAGGYN
ncbi:hypothetical protein [Pedobacter sp. NJ-S-72]